MLHNIMNEPGLGTASMLAVALGVLSSFLLATIFHELGHLAIARLLRVPVKLLALGQGPALWRRILPGGLRLEVRLLPLGMAVGVVGRRTLDGHARRPIVHDIAMAAGGPLASFLLAFLLIALAVVTGAGAASAWPGDWLIGTALLSALLGLLNLIPVPGLDGGHLAMLLVALCGFQLSPQREVAVQRLGIRLTAALSLVMTLALVLKAH